jgi:hypothetical protein
VFRSSDRHPWRLLTLALLILVTFPFLVGYHWARLGWRDKHLGYPPVPSGYTQIVNTFGPPCGADAHAVTVTIRESDTGQYVETPVHRRLAGRATEMLSDKGGRSTNLDNDVMGHIKNEHLTPYVKSNVWAYVCRTIRGGDAWSTHAWGIAIDVSSLHEHYPDHFHSHVNYHHSDIWLDHGWIWGRRWGDAMHFQYAKDY